MQVPSENRMKILTLASLLAIPCLALAASAGRTAVSEQPDEYAVWSVVLNYGYPAAASRQLVIENEIAAIAEAPTQKGTPAHHSYSEIEAITDESRRPFTLEKRFTLELPYVLIPRRKRPEPTQMCFDSGTVKIDNVAKLQKEWDQFYKKYPGAYGIVGLSRVAFLNHGTQAAVMVSSRERISISAEKLYLLARKNGSWEVESVTPLSGSDTFPNCSRRPR